MANVARAFVTTDVILVSELAAAVRSNTAGAIVTFSGDVRDNDHGRDVASLEYEAHPTAQNLLEKVAGDIGFIETAKDHTLDNSALADYGVAGIENERLSVGIAGIVGVIATGVLMYLIVKFISRKKK